MKIMKILVSILILLFIHSISFAIESPSKSTPYEKGTQENCKNFIKNKSKEFSNSNYKCRVVLAGVVYVCDNEKLHLELVCEGSKAFIEEFKQINDNWKKFYIQ